MKSFLNVLWDRPAELSLLCRYTMANGVLYLGLGALIYGLPPDLLASLFFLDGFDGFETGLVRVVGIAVGIIGWFYVMGGRTGRASFGLATVVDRALLPLLLLPPLISGALPPGLGVPFAILDPVLALGAYAIWRSEAARGATTGT